MPYTVPEQKERNDDLVKTYNDWVVQLGRPVMDVCTKFNMTPQRMYQILKKRGINTKKGFRKAKPKKA